MLGGGLPGHEAAVGVGAEEIQDVPVIGAAGVGAAGTALEAAEPTVFAVEPEVPLFGVLGRDLRAGEEILARFVDQDEGGAVVECDFS